METTTVGKLLDDKAERDAIHVAIAPVIASERLHPGQRIALDEHAADRACAVYGRMPAIGIVDPFLAQPVESGQRFWLFLFPGTVTGIRHHWQHPALAEASPLAARTSDARLAQRRLLAPVIDSLTPPGFPPLVNEEDVLIATDYWEEAGNAEAAQQLRAIPAAQQWMRDYAEEFGLSYRALIDAGKNWIEHGDQTCLRELTPDCAYSQRHEFWQHFQLLTGIPLTDEQQDATIFVCAC